MFLVHDLITREYHLALPPGAFKFGYAVDASWWPPSKTPVTKPATDFPKEANAEDPWLIELEQLLPICEENVGKDIFKIVVHHRGQYPFWVGNIWVWDISTDCPPETFPEFWGMQIEEQIDEFTSVYFYSLKYNWWNNCGPGIVPGHHFALLVINDETTSWEPEDELKCIIKPQFIDIYVQE